MGADPREGGTDVRDLGIRPLIPVAHVGGVFLPPSSFVVYCVFFMLFSSLGVFQIEESFCKTNAFPLFTW